VDADGLTSVDLLEEIRTALDGLEPALLGRTIDIEMPRLRVLADPMLFRRMFADLIGCAVAHSEPPDSITVHVARTGKEARIEVVNESGHVAGDELPDLASAAEELRAMGGEIGTGGPVGAVIYWMTLPLAPGVSSAADA
jgi:light-regulated signal transduction histidine kinase (bacteriophytochrome)